MVLAAEAGACLKEESVDERAKGDVVVWWERRLMMVLSGIDTIWIWTRAVSASSWLWWRIG